MKTVMTALAGTVMFAASAVASESWTDMPAPSGPLMTVQVEGGHGDAAPHFGAPTGIHDNVAAAREVTIFAEGDAYNVTPVALEGERGASPRAIASAPRPGGG